MHESKLNFAGNI